MKASTLKELRAEAKARGIKGYSKLTKEELVRLLGKPESAPVSSKPAATAHAQQTSAPVKAEARKPSAAPGKTSTAAPTVEPAVEPIPPAAPVGSFASAEELVEDAKYALRPHGQPAPHPPADLGEDIDRLPRLPESMVCLLPQKPGILYAYWALPPGERSRHGDYKLRLCDLSGNTLQVVEEVGVSSDRGGWYFHVPEAVSGHSVAAQLGYYRDGQFVSAQGQSIARLPSLYASARTDHRWWISQEDFARMYLRGGGAIVNERYRWTSSASSPAAPPGPPEQQMSWPGGVSSSR